jgi:hypothetical protein
MCENLSDILLPVRQFLLVTAMILTGCSSAPGPVAKAKPDPATQDWYVQTVEQLKSMNGEAEAMLQRGKYDEAAAIITNGQPLQSKILAVPRPTLAATEAASDLDQMYGRMLLRNRHYGWARLLFQKNLARWKNWKPETADSERRLKMAVDGIAECDRHLGE